jgi:hypothetical protein
MAYRLYIVPTIGAGTIGPPPDPRRPKYFDGLKWDGMDYGFQPIFLVAADLTPAQDASIVANPDVDALPFDLSPTVGGGNVQAARNALEAALIPAQWINGQMTWLTVARMIGGMFQFMQRLNFYLGSTVLIDSSAKLNAQWQQIPVDPYQNAIFAATNSLDYTFNPNPNDQLRTLLQQLGQQWGSAPFFLGGFTF